MPAFAVAVRGRGRATVAAYGLADAEHLVQKEIARAWPDARVAIAGVSRVGEGRIVEELGVDYVLTAMVEVEADSQDDATGAAFRRARQLLSDTRYRLTAWERLTPPAS